MTLELTPSATASPATVTSAGTPIVVTASVGNRAAYAGKGRISGLTTITPKIVINRSPSGVLPFKVYCSGAYTESDAGVPFSDLHFAWDFGDPSGAELLTDYYNGQSINANDQQTGPEVEYIYRTAGTYTITLTVTGKDGSGNLVTASTTSIMTLGRYYPFLGGATGGTWTLTIAGQTTSALAVNATDAQVEAAIFSLSSVGADDLIYNYNGNTFELVGQYVGQTVTVTADFSGLTGTTGTPQLRIEQASTTSASVTVGDQSGISWRYYDSTYTGTNGVSDGTITRPYTTWSNFATWAAGGNNRGASWARGSDITMTSILTFGSNQSTFRMQAHGTGAKPIFRNGTSGYFQFEMTYGSAGTPNQKTHDFVFSDLDCRGITSGFVFRCYGSNNGSSIQPYSRVCDIYLDNVEYTATTIDDCSFASMASVTGRGEALSSFGLWKCTLNAGTAGGNTVYTQQEQWFGTTGSYIYGGDGDLSLHHHIYASVFNKHIAINYQRFGAGSKNYCFNGNAVSSGQAIRFVQLNGCDITGTKNGCDFSNTDNNYNSGRTGHFDRVLISHCKIHSGGVSPTEQNGIFCYNLDHITIRDCEFWDHAQSHWTSNDTTKPTKWECERNRFWDGVCNFGSGQTVYFHDNVSATITTSRPCVSYFSQANAEAWDCDGNMWYAPNATSPFRLAPSTFVNFATWQGYGNDAAGSVTNPAWSDPDNGVFRDGTTIACNWPDSFTSLEYSTDSGGSYSAYTDNQAISLADSASRQVVLFRANTPAANGTFNIVVTSDSTSADIASETDTTTVSASGAVNYLSIAYGSNLLVIAAQV